MQRRRYIASPRTIESSVIATGFRSGIFRGFIWQLATYPCVATPSSGVWFLLELLIVFWFGRTVYNMLGQRRFWKVLLTAAVGAAVVAVVVEWVAITVSPSFNHYPFIAMLGQRMVLTILIAAFATLYEVLVTFAKVAAPVLPFISEELYQRLVRDLDDTAAESVHHTDYPTANDAVINEDIEAAMQTVRSIVTLGHGLRKRHEVKVRQPLSVLTVITRDAAVAQAVKSHEALIAEELNVRSLHIDPVEDHIVHLSAQANFKSLGPRLGAATKTAAAEIANLPHETISRILDGGTVEIAGTAVAAADIVVRREPRAGLVVAAEGTLSVALDVTVTAELAAEGLAREVVSVVQGVRRSAGLEVSDRISMLWQAENAELVDAISEHKTMIAGELLATSIERSDSAQSVAVEINEMAMTVSLHKE